MQSPKSPTRPRFTSWIRLHGLFSLQTFLIGIPVLIFFSLFLVIFVFVYNASFFDSKELSYPKSSHLRVKKDTTKSFELDHKRDHAQDQVQAHPTHLIMVPGHAAMHIEKLANADHSDEAWYLLSYQKNQGYPKIISMHIQKSIELLKKDEQSLLIFSGGQTRHDVGPLSEAASYYYLAEYHKWIHSGNSNRIFLEEFARDSFENLLFSLCRFHEITSHYPQQITIVGFDFKGPRYTNLHRKALYYPELNFTYVGIVSPEPFNQEHAVEGEKSAYEEFSKDLYGCNDHTLHEKRVIRNPFHRSIPYELSCPELKVLLEWCGSNLIDKHYIPWSVT